MEGTSLPGQILHRGRDPWCVCGLRGLRGLQGRGRGQFLTGGSCGSLVLRALGVPTNMPLAALLPEIAALLRRGPYVRIEDAETVLRPVLDSWWWKPQLATQALKTLATAGFPNTASQVLEVLRRNNIGPTLIQYNAAIHASSKHGQWVAALYLANSMQIDYVMPDLTTCNSAMSACDWQIVCQFLRKIQEFDLIPDNFSFSLLTRAALKVARKQQSWRLAVQSLEVQTRYMYPNVVSRSAAISACAAASSWRFALQIFDASPDANAITYGGVLNACDKGSQWNCAVDIFRRINTAMQIRNPILCNSLISACSAGSCWERALALLEHMALVLVERDLFSFCGVAKACGEAGKWERALAILASVEEVRLKVNPVMSSTVVSACTQVSRWEAALILVTSELRIANQWSFSAAITAQKSWTRALRLFHLIQSVSVETDLPCRNALFLACQGPRRWQHALLSATKQLEPFKHPPENQRVVVISTNVAETSVTLPNVSPPELHRELRYVVDCGREKRRRRAAQIALVFGELAVSLTRQNHSTDSR
ncbi:Pentatricopeptide repeat-containing protein At1g74850 [Durusdinium trenchii]|uniref:Chloroplastic (Protein PLASTID TRANSCRIPTIONALLY ACTIVE 2) n=1 Tax=Durusdinium trenchii TaxID=1381693 RepID=A0ABP0LPJ1_9DINO